MKLSLRGAVENFAAGKGAGVEKHPQMRAHVIFVVRLAVFFLAVKSAIEHGALGGLMPKLGGIDDPKVK
jgi:hypothetical protein